jgi:hypothetical protein
MFTVIFLCVRACVDEAHHRSDVSVSRWIGYGFVLYDLARYLRCERTKAETTGLAVVADSSSQL